MGRRLQGVWEPLVSLTVLLQSQIQFIFKFSKEEKAQSIAQAPGVPSDPRSLCLLALISTSESGRSWDQFLLGQGRSCRLAGAAPSHPHAGRCFTVRSGLGKKWLEALGGGSFRCLQGHTWEVSRSGLGSCMGPAELNCKGQARNSTLCSSAAHGSGAVPTGSGECGMPNSVLPANCPLSSSPQLLLAV